MQCHLKLNELSKMSLPEIMKGKNYIGVFKLDKTA